MENVRNLELELRPGHVGRRDRDRVLAEANCGSHRRYLCDQRVRVSVDLGLLIPIWIRVFVEFLTLGNYVEDFAVPAMPPLIGGEAIKQRPARGPLHIHIQRRVDAQSALMNLVAAILRFQVASDFFHIVRSQRIRIFLQVEQDRFVLRIRGLCGGDLAVLKHGVEHEVTPPEGAFRMGYRGIILRGLGKSREQRSFFQFELPGRLAEIGFRGGLLAVGTVAQEYLVGVEGEDLRLGEPALDLDGEQCLLHLAIEGAVGREKQVARQLHRERRCSLHFPARFEVAIRSAYDTPDIDARVPVEVFIFDRDKRIAENLGIVVVRGDDAALQRKGADDPSLSVIEYGDGAGTVTFEFVDLGQVRRVDQQESGGRADRGGEQDEQSEEDESHQLQSANFYRRKMLVDDFHQRAQGWDAGFNASGSQRSNVTGSVSLCGPKPSKRQKKSPAEASDCRLSH